jgi:uridine monophosphate synthetase
VFLDRWTTAREATGSRLCVGIDPRDGTVSEIRDRVRRVIAEAAESACAFKPNSAFFEALGGAGTDLLAEAVERIHATRRPAILDAKRGDIASTAEAYARAAFAVLGADAVTVVPYMGEDAILPFLACGGTAFVVALPSNPAAARLVDHGDPPLYMRVAEMAAELEVRFPGQVGLVVGATRPDKARAVHDLAPNLPWLVPGLGAQGGDVVAFERGARHEAVLYNVSRGILEAQAPAAAAREWKERIGGGRR